MEVCVMIMMEVYNYVRTIFWSEWFWFGGSGHSWVDFIDKDDGIRHPQYTDLRWALYLGLVIFLIRKIAERYVAAPIGRLFGIRDTKPRKPPPNPVLENAFRCHKFPDHDKMQNLSKQTDLSTRKVERWFRMRRNQDRPSLMKRFTEAAWRFAFYFSVFIYGVVVLWDKPWFADSTNCWVGYPHHHIPPSIFWYYMIEIGFYSSLMFSQFIDVKRKDFWEMFTHHVATMLLLCFSWSGNFVRVGTLVLVIHDAVDFWMEAAKMAKYLKAQRLCDVLFAIFGIVWFVTRLVIFPVRVIYSTYFELPILVGNFPAVYMFNAMLCLLLVLHAYWFSLIVKVTYDVLTNTGEEVTDIRSSEEENVSEDENGHAIQPNNNHNHNHNHNHNKVKAVS
ncbi:ceramide synthase 2-like isoform X1 [Pecten maximus]|uniref:ceramide synthase 2-like isoform X1 n=1 Tax=Pecten maximus TaxID=6579 RepID=UPI0014586817|nr:ceramide synthase 2-like isoform X1 [Pecten maximus]